MLANVANICILKYGPKLAKSLLKARQQKFPAKYDVEMRARNDCKEWILKRKATIMFERFIKQNLFTSLSIPEK